MKIRAGFVSNSSSSSFLITNTSAEPKTLVDFVLENEHLVDQFKKRYEWHHGDEHLSLKNMISDAASDHYSEEFAPGQEIECIFGDEDGTVLGQVFDYMLRDGGCSASFTWDYHESLR